MTLQEFQNDIRAGIPDRLPAAKPYDKQSNHTPKRKGILTPEEEVLAIRNALRYSPAKHHATGQGACRGAAQILSLINI